MNATEKPAFFARPSTLFISMMLIWASMFVMRWAAPSDLLDKDQERPAAYMLDAAVNGNWIVQVDDHGRVCSKPPVYTWLGAGLILLLGRMYDFALYFPSALGVLGCCVLMWRYGGRHFGIQAAFAGVAMLLLSTIGLRIIYLARTDALFSMATFLTACMGYRAFQHGRSWMWFWGAATLATLTKGPLGLVLAAGGLIGLVFRNPRQTPAGNVKAQHVVGVLFYLVVSLGWLVLAYTQLGDAVIAKIIGRELYGHTDWNSERFSVDVSMVIMPTLYFLSRFFPWSVVSLWGLWKVFKHPAQNSAERSFERFLASYLIIGILLFSVFPHQRPDHLFPLLPAAGLLAGRELIRWLTKRNQLRYLLPLSLGFWAVLFIGFSIYYVKIDPASNPWFARTAGVRELARQYEATHGENTRLIFVDVPFGFQYYLNSMHQRVTYAQAAEQLKSPRETLAAVKDIQKLRDRMPDDARLSVLMQWPNDGEGYIYIVSNMTDASRSSTPVKTLLQNRDNHGPK